MQRAGTEIEVFDALETSITKRFGLGIGLYRLSGSGPQPIGNSLRDADWLELAGMACQSMAEQVNNHGLCGYSLSGRNGAVVGALVRMDKRTGAPDQNFMVALARVVALALERVQLSRQLAEAHALARAEELKTVLLSSVSHDLRSPLTAINTSAASLLQFGKSFDDATSRELLTGIVEESDRLNHLTSNLLQMTRLQSGDGNLRSTVLPASEMMRSIVARKRRLAQERKILFSAPSGEVPIEADVALFDLAITNVLQNAVRYSPPETTIRVKCDVDGTDCVISVSDEGIGIPLEDQQRVFERFYRVDRSERIPRGSGLGLAIAKGFVEASKGSITITSPIKNNRGTEITIRLPIAPAHEVAHG